MKPELIHDVASGNYQAIETFLHRPLTPHEHYQLARRHLQSHLKYADVREEFEYVIQRRSNEAELRNLLHGREDPALIGTKEQYDDNRKRTHDIVHRLLKKLADDYAKHPLKQESSVDSLSLDLSPPPTEDSPSPSPRRSEPSKAFEPLPRVVERIAEKEALEAANILTEAIEQFREKSTTREIVTDDGKTSRWFSELRKTLPDERPLRTRETPAIPLQEDLYLGWTLFKGADRAELGLREEAPRMIQVKHRAQTFVVGIPEEYADARSRSKENEVERTRNVALEILPRESIVANRFGQDYPRLI